MGRVALPRPPRQWAEDEAKNPLLLVSSGVWWWVIGDFLYMIFITKALCRCVSGCNLEIENHVAPATFLLFSDCVWCSEGNFMQAFSVEEPHRTLFKSNYMWYTDFFNDIWFKVWTVFFINILYLLLSQGCWKLHRRAARDLSRVSEEIAERQEKMATEGEKVEKEKVLPKDAQVNLQSTCI